MKVGTGILLRCAAEGGVFFKKKNNPTRTTIEFFFGVFVITDGD